MFKTYTNKKNVCVGCCFFLVDIQEYYVLCVLKSHNLMLFYIH